MHVKNYTVFRFNYIRQVSEPVGKLVERRSRERGDNVGSLLRLAQRFYSKSSLDSHIFITPEHHRGSRQWAGL